MAYSKKTLADLKQSLADKHDSGVLPIDAPTLNLWTRLLNRAKDEIARELKIPAAKVDVTTTNGSVAVANSFMATSKVYTSDNIPMTQITPERSEGAVGLYYWISGNYEDGFYFNVPGDENGTYTLYTSAYLEDMVDGSDVCPIPDSEAVVWRAYADLRRSETDPLEDADKAEDRSDDAVADMIEVMNVNSGPFGFYLQPNA